MEKTNDIIKPQKFRCNKFNKKDTKIISFLDDTEDDSRFNRNSWYKKKTNIINYLHNHKLFALNYSKYKAYFKFPWVLNYFLISN